MKLDFFLMLPSENQPIKDEFCFSNTIFWRITNQRPASSRSDPSVLFQQFKMFFEKIQSKTFQFSRVALKEKKIDFLIDGKNDYIFHNFLEVFVQNRVILLSKGLLEKVSQSKSLLLQQILSIKALNLRLNYT